MDHPTNNSRICILFKCLKNILGLYPGSADKEPACQCRRHKRYRFNPLVGKIPWRRKWQPTPVLLPRKSHGRRSLVQATVHGVAESRTRLSDPAPSNPMGKNTLIEITSPLFFSLWFWILYPLLLFSVISLHLGSTQNEMSLPNF